MTYMGISPLEYFRCRRERRQMDQSRGGWGAHSFARWRRSTAAWRLAASRWALTSATLIRVVRAEEMGLYYGVDVEHSGRPTRVNGAFAPAPEFPPTSSSSCSRAESATRRIRKQSCGRSRSPAAEGSTRCF